METQVTRELTAEPTIRSAGTDRVMWTADDLHREPNGAFLRGNALNPERLYRG